MQDKLSWAECSSSHQLNASSAETGSGMGDDVIAKPSQKAQQMQELSPCRAYVKQTKSVEKVKRSNQSWYDPLPLVTKLAKQDGTVRMNEPNERQWLFCSYLATLFRPVWCVACVGVSRHKRAQGPSMEGLGSLGEFGSEGTFSRRPGLRGLRVLAVWLSVIIRVQVWHFCSLRHWSQHWSQTGWPHPLLSWSPSCCLRLVALQDAQWKKSNEPPETWTAYISTRDVFMFWCICHGY